MMITVQVVGRFREVIFRDVENDEVRARSGLLDDDEASALAERLREVSRALEHSETVDDHQAVLPFYGSNPARSFGRDHELAAGNAVGY